MILKSKAVWTAVVSAVISIGLFAVSAYTLPPLSDLLKISIVGIQAVAVALIAEFCVEKVNQNLRVLISQITKLR